MPPDPRGSARGNGRNRRGRDRGHDDGRGRDDGADDDRGRGRDRHPAGPGPAAAGVPG